MTPSDLTVEVVLGDITLQHVDAIVNAANSQLAGGGGVDGAIHRATGAAELQAACRRFDGCPAGAAVSTPGFALVAASIIHTVGPVWHGGSSGEAETLAACYRSCLAEADRLTAKSIAFPAISTGAYGYPPDLAAAVALSVVRETPTEVRLVRFVVFSQSMLEFYQRLL